MNATLRPVDAPPVEKDTVAMYFVNAALLRVPAALREDVLLHAGIAPELLSIAHARVPATAFAALWLAVAQALDDEFFGLDARRMKVGSFALLCQAVLPTGQLDHALRRYLRGIGLMLDEVSARLDLDPQAPQDLALPHPACVRLENRIADPAARRFADETFLIMLHGLLCWLAGKRIPLARVDFAHAMPAHAAEYAVMYSQHLRFDAPRTVVWLDVSLLRAPVVQTAETLRAFLEQAPQSVFLKYKNPDSWTARVRRRLRDCIASADWPGFDNVALEYGLAPTTLRRRLEAEGSSYQDVKDALRRDAAIDHLCHGKLPIAEIAAVLGYQEPSAFHRAFKRWTGAQPGEYRLRQRPS